jgi:hypothetical protein
MIMLAWMSRASAGASCPWPSMTTVTMARVEGPYAHTAVVYGRGWCMRLCSTAYASMMCYHHSPCALRRGGAGEHAHSHTHTRTRPHTLTHTDTHKHNKPTTHAHTQEFGFDHDQRDRLLGAQLSLAFSVFSIPGVGVWPASMTNTHTHAHTHARTHHGQEWVASFYHTRTHARTPSYRHRRALHTPPHE